MATNRTTQTSMTAGGNIPSREGAGSMLLWTALLVIGGACAAFGAFQHRKADLEAAHRNQAAVYLQGQANQFVSQVIQSGSQGPGSHLAASSVIDTRERTRTVLSVLQRGGPLPQLNLYISPLPDQGQALARAAHSSLSNFDQAAQPILTSAPALAKMGVALSAFDQASTQFLAAADETRKSPRFAAGSWGNALSQVVRDLAPDNQPLSSSFLAGGTPSNDPRITQIRTRVADMHNLARASVNDNSMSQGERASLTAMARAATGMLNAMDEVLRQRANTASIASSLPAAVEAAPAVDSSISSLVAGLSRLPSGSQNWVWVSIIGWVIAALGGLMLLRQGWDALGRQYHLYMDARNAQVLATAHDRLSNRLRRILSLESREQQLREPPESPAFTLATLINKILEQRFGAAGIMEEHGQDLLRIAHEMDAILNQMSGFQQDSDRLVASSHINTGHFSGLVSQGVEDLLRHRDEMDVAINQVSRVSGLTQSALWALDQVREKTQDASKRIKRLGESAQSVSSSADAVRDIARQAKVLALNVAIGAAQRGEDGRIFADVAKELESLARDLDIAVADIDFQSNGIQDDSRQTVEVMEQGVASIVECAKLSGDANVETKNLLTHVQNMDQRQAEIAEGLEAASKGVLKEQGSLATALAAIRQLGDKITALRERLATPRSAVHAFRAWLGQLGRDI